MPNLLVYPIRRIGYKIRSHFLNLNEKPKCLIISPGGCGSISLTKFLDKFIKSNLYLEKKYKIFALGHLYRPPSSFKKQKIKIILIKRNLNEIYKSMKSRGFIRNSLNIYGDLFPFVYINIFKSNIKIKKKYINYLKLFYKNWNDYNKNLILKIDFKTLFNYETKLKIKKFLEIKNKTFLKKYPKYKRYKKNKNFIDPSTLLAKKIYKIN
jgi:hypothetical protein|tara:strand:+ start:1222 stop:1851 length:630 start_codon:yes stop_codon:yes gene_type:complete